jgi:beta-glucosidase
MLFVLTFIAVSLPVYLDPNRPIEDRIQDLIDNMTLEEKVGQMMQIAGAADIPARFAKYHPGSVGHVFGNSLKPIFKAAREERLKIPGIYPVNAMHGNARFQGATIFPMQIAIAASWDIDIIKQMAIVTTKEMKYTGHSTVLGPVLCIARDHRWGRVDETFGEDPYLIGEVAAAMIRGYKENKVLSCAKHFAAYSETHGGLDATEMDVTRRMLHGFFLPQFKKAVDAGVEMVMSAFESLEGVPCVMNKWLMRDLLKGEWNYSGFIVTDYDTLGGLVTMHKVAKNLEDAAVLAVDGGTDVVLGNDGFHKACVSAVRNGKLSEKWINDSVRRVLRAKFEIGLFEDDRYPDLNKAQIGTPEHRSVALTACRESLILLKNDGILPFDPKSLSVSKIAVLGPNANSSLAQNGDWSLEMGRQPRNITITVLDGLKKRLPNAKITFEAGAILETTDTANLTAAIELAKSSDVIIVVIGDRVRYTGEKKSTATLNLMGTQLDLLKALVDLKKKFIINFIAGKPLEIPEYVINAASAIVCQFIPGGLGGQAFAEAIVGDYSPSGRLTISWPRHVGQLPLYYNVIRGQHKPHHYADLTQKWQWGFGYGLTYSKIVYGNATINKRVFGKNDVMRIKMNVVNNGPFDAVEVVQFYVHDCVTSVTWAEIELKGYCRVGLKVGESREVLVEIPVNELGIVTEEGKRVVESGDMVLYVAKSVDEKVQSIQFVIE